MNTLLTPYVNLPFGEKVVDILTSSLSGHKRDYFLYHKYELIQQYYGSACLDVGSGNGDFSKFLRNRNHQVTSIDVVDQSRHNPTYLFNGKDVPFDDDSFDTSLLMFVLHHTDFQQELLKDLIRVTKDHIIIAEDIICNGFDRMLGAIHLNSSPWVKGNDSFKTHDGWLAVFKDLELEVVNTVNITRWTYPVYPVVRNIYILKVNK